MVKEQRHYNEYIIKNETPFLMIYDNEIISLQQVSIIDLRSFFSLINLCFFHLIFLLMMDMLNDLTDLCYVSYPK